MMDHSQGKTRASLVTKITCTLIFATFAVIFLAFPLGGASAAPSASTLRVKLSGAYKVTDDGTPSDQGKFWGTNAKSVPSFPIAVSIDTNVKATDIPVGALVQVKAPANTKSADNSPDATGLINALCIAKGQVILVQGTNVVTAKLV